MKTYKFLALIGVRFGQHLDSTLAAKLNKKYNHLRQIKAERITTATKMALAKLERLAKRTKLPWRLMDEAARIIGEADGKNSLIWINRVFPVNLREKMS
jgi:transcription initiation factor TFIIIB Brf1 subunit/transcription initiation factor TFIIB